MNQAAHIEITKMLNGFPQMARNTTALLLTYEEDLEGISDQAICETARRFRRNKIDGQSTEFGPSIAAFVEAARRLDEIYSRRSRPALPGPVPMPRLPDRAPLTEEERERQRERMAAFHRSLQTTVGALTLPPRGDWFVEHTRDPFRAKTA